MPTLSQTRSPGTTANVDRQFADSPWLTTDNAKVSDDSYTTSESTFSFEQGTDYLVLTNFLFTIPINASIVGIEASNERKKGGNEPETWFVSDHTIRLWNGSLIGNNMAEPDLWEESEDTIIYGGSSNLWGLTPVPSDVNDSEFGIAIAVEFIDLDGLDSTLAMIDHVQLTIYYEPAGLLNTILPQYKRKRTRLYV